jgi:rod shape-determining protein MreD
MRYTALLAFGLCLLILQENFFRLTDAAIAVLERAHPGHYSLPGLVPSLALPILLFMGVREYPLARGAGIAFVLGYVSDLLGAAPVGLYAFTFVALFTLVRTAGLRLAAQTRWMQLMITFGFTLVKSFVVLLLIAIFGREAWVPRSVFPMMFPHALATAFFGPFIFMLLERIHDWTQSAPSPGAAGASN